MNKFKHLCISSLVVGGLFGFGSFANAAETTKTDDIILYFEDKEALELAVKDLSKESISVTYEELPAVVISSDSHSVEELKQLEGITSVEPNVAIQLNVEEASVQPVDVSALNMWGREYTKADKAHTYGITGKGIKVGIADTGINMNHPDLRYVKGISFVQDKNANGVIDTTIMDYHGHGSHVAGIIAALNDDVGITGVAPNADIYVMKIFNKEGEGTTAELLSAIDWAISNDLDILNLSLGAQNGFASFQNAINFAYGEGVLIVSAAGNDFKDAVSEGGCANNVLNDCVDYPGKYDKSVTVAAIDNDYLKADFSSVGSAVDVAAPGVTIASTYLNQSYVYMSGTSMAAPYVAGVLALYKEKHPTATNDELVNLLIGTTIDRGAAGKDNLYGEGYVQVDLDKALPRANSVPLVAKPIPNQVLAIGETVKIDLSKHFTDAENDVITYQVSKTGTNTSNLEVKGNELVLSATAQGSTTVTVSASDKVGIAGVSTAFQVTVVDIEAIPYNASVYLLERTNIYNQSSMTSGVVATLSEQSVFAYQQKGEWFEINTWLGKKWIKPTKFLEGPVSTLTKRIDISSGLFLHDTPSSTGIRLEKLGKQSVYSKLEWNGWYLIGTWIGDKWIKPASTEIEGYIEILQLTEGVYLHTGADASAKTTSMLSPQNVYAYEKRDGWYKVRTWLGDRWIKPTKFTVQKPELINKPITLTKGVNLHSLPYKALSEYVSPQQVFAVEKLGNWYYINTWVGKKWVLVE